MGSYAPAPTRDSLELGSLASSSSAGSPRSSLSSNRLSFDSSAGHDPERPGRHRSYSVSSAFDFNTHLVPLTPSAPGAGNNRYASMGGSSDNGSLERQKSLTFINSLALLLGLQIGSGIFSSPSQVNNHAGSPGAALLIWFVAGILAWTGAASYAELGGAIPLNGGAQAYLRYCFGEGVSFSFAWTAVMVLKPGSAAIIAIIFGEYVLRVFSPSGGANMWLVKGIALIALMVVTGINAVSTKLTMRLSDLFMYGKILALLLITVLGIVVAATGLNLDGTGASRDWRERNWFTPAEGRGGWEMGEWAIALYAGLWAFDGWDNVNYVVGEMKHPTRDLPRVIHTAMPVVISSYLLANMAYYFVLPYAIIGSSNTVAVAFGTKIFGPLGGILFALAVTLSCFGALNATTFTSGRLVYAAGKEGYLPSLFGKLGLRMHHEEPGSTRITTDSKLAQAGRKCTTFFVGDTEQLGATPIYAMLLNAGLTACYILVGEFGTLLTFYGVAGYSFYFLTVLGLIMLRIKEPGLERPYRTWITTPICFCCVSLFLISRGVFQAPIQTLAVVGFVSLSIPVFWWRVGGGWKGFWAWVTRRGSRGG
ncbi:amino acid transporter [Ascobolus immersus RN42]|uniref:Amino acid transporter n=1 Tax=Ascobolus immersus RN42 TaxID=1160509 RepID=A0A3N4HCT3_ASCIM|nr:amino acid transporter [Ascobolus immersus RN42]